MNPYVIGNLSGTDPRLIRVLRDLAERNNQLAQELESAQRAMPPVGAKKESPVEGIIQLGGGGFIRVSKDGVIKSYTNPSDALSGGIEFPYIDLRTVTSVGASSILHTLTLPPGTLVLNGDTLEVVYGGSFAQNDNNKIVNASFGGNTYEPGGAIDIDGGSNPGGVGWRLIATIARLSATTVRVNHSMLINAMFVDSTNAVNSFGLSGFLVTREREITVPNLNSSSTVMNVSGIGVANADVFQNLSFIDLKRPGTVMQ